MYLRLNSLELFHSRAASEMQSAADVIAWPYTDEKLDVLANLPSDHYVVLVRTDTADGNALLDGGVPLVYRTAETPAAPKDLTARVQIGNALDVVAVVEWLIGRDQ